MKESGIEDFFMHARGGLKTEYMGDDWFDCIKACMDKADELNMEAWAYDENGWPSGFASGIVPKKSVDFQQKKLETAWLNKGDKLPENLLGLYKVGENGFAMVVGLTKDTNTELSYKPADGSILIAKNKWLIAHPNSNEAVKNHCYAGIVGENYTINYF